MRTVEGVQNRPAVPDYHQSNLSEYRMPQHLKIGILKEMPISPLILKARSLPLATLLLIVAMCVIEYLAVNGERRTTWNQDWGFIPSKPITYITHAFLHTSEGHLTVNMFVFLVFGSLTEKHLGAKWILAITVFAAITGAWSGIHVVPAEKWPTEINPVGFSSVSYAFLVTGTFSILPIAAKILTNLESRTDLAWVKLRISKIADTLRRATPSLGFLAATGACGWVLATEFGEEGKNPVGQVGHSVGAIIGMVIVIALAILQPRPPSSPASTWTKKFIKKILFNPLIVLILHRNTNPANEPMTTRILREATVVIPAVIFVALVVVPFTTSPIGMLPKPSESGTFLGNLLTAQAAIAALTLAVSLFVMQGVSAKEDLDDRTYREYLNRSWVTRIFWNSLLALLITGTILLLMTLLNESYPIDGLRNLTLVAATAFAANLALAGALFGRALHLAHPQRWRTLSRDLNRQDVRRGVQVFLSRYDRAITSLEANDPDVTTVLPDPGERSSDEAIRALLDDARRAMDERRQGEFQTSLNSIQELVTYAMDELDNRSHGWAPPGAQPEWPPLRELGRNLYPFREEILRQGSREYLFELLQFDYWLITTGMQRNCGELFSVGLDGYRRNNQISSSIGGTDFQGITVDRFWQVADGLYLKTEPEEAFPFIREMIRHQERMLSDAMHADRSDDFTRLHRGLEKSFRFLRGKWEADNWQDPNSATLYRTLEQDYRIVLMGLSGRAAILAQDGKVAGMGPYAVAARRTYSNTDLLTNDLDQALRQEQQPRRSQWSEWEWQTEGEEDGRARFRFPEQYPFSFFSIRLMELVDDPILTLNMHGNAKRVLDWFTNNSERLGRYVRPEADLAVELAQPNVNPEHELDVERRRQIANEVLERAVSNDEVQENLEIISRPLSDDRVSNFVSEVYATAFATDRVEPLFEQRKAFLYLSNESENIPEERGFHILEGKGFLTEMPEFSRTSYAPLEGDRWGLGISNDVIHLLCEALDDAPEIRALTDTPEEFLQAIDRVEEELNSGEMVIVLAGNWIDLEVELNQGLPEGYEPGWRLPDNERLAEMGRYRGHSIIRGPRGSERRLYLVDPRNWGCLVRAQFENNQDLRVEVKPVSSDRAEKLLDANSSYFPDEPDGESELRRLQTFVEIIVGARIEFRKTNGSRARQIINPAQNSDSNDAAQVVSGEAERTTTSMPVLIP